MLDGGARARGRVERGDACGVCAQAADERALRDELERDAAGEVEGFEVFVAGCEVGRVGGG